MAISILLKSFLGICFFLHAVCGIQEIQIVTFEDIPVGSIVGDLSQGARLHLNLTSDELQSVKYTLINQTSTLASIFGVSPVGCVFSIGEVDREALCPFKFFCTMTPDVLVSGGSPPRSGLLPVTIKILDVNDNAPEFLSPTYNVTIDGQNALNHVILQVSATDKDAGRNAVISYELKEASNMYTQKFKINSFTGEITVIAPLTVNFTEFFVVAKDSLHTSRALVRVSVLNLPDPHLSLIIPESGDTNTVFVSEGAFVGSIIADVVIDQSVSDRRNVFCEIQPRSGVFYLLQTNPTRRKIMLHTFLDRERKDSYKLAISCRDQVHRDSIATVYLTVTVTDVNDNVPMFEQARYQATVTENSFITTSILQVKAIDLDSGGNAKLQYWLDHNTGDADKFRMNANTGVIYAFQTLDREVKQKYFLTVTVEDGGTPPLSSRTIVEVTVLDVNDNAPIFSHYPYTFIISEKTSVGEVFGQLTAVDVDIGQNAMVDFFFYNGSQAAKDSFSVSRSGQIRTLKKLNRDDGTKYSFSAIAKDNGQPVRTAITTVQIEVLYDPVVG